MKDFALVRDLISLGATRYFTKPVDLQKLLSELRQHITFPAAHGTHAEPSLAGQGR